MAFSKRAATVVLAMAFWELRAAPVDCASAAAGQAGVCKDLQEDGAARVATELLQRLARRSEQSGPAAALAEPGAAALAQKQEGEQLPGWGDLMDSVTAAANSTMKSVTDSVNSIAGSVTEAMGNSSSISSIAGSIMNSSSISDAMGALTDAVQNSSSLGDAVGSLTNSILNGSSASVAKVTGSLADTAAQAVAGALNQSLNMVGAQADSFLASCQKSKDSLMAQMNRTERQFEARAAVLEANATAAVAAALPMWDEVTAMVTASTSTLTSVLASAGLSELGDGLNSSLSKALTQAARVRVALDNVSGVIANLSALPQASLAQQMESIQDLLQQGLDEADRFAVNMSAAFGDLTDQAATKIAEMVPGANRTAIDATFDQVDATVADVAAKFVSGPEALITGLSDATASVEETLPKAHSAAGSSGISAFFAAAILLWVARA